ncbi:MAG: Gldg family protein [Chloroflexota bacterium]
MVVNRWQTPLIFRREFAHYFLSPVAYIVIAIFLVVAGWFFFSPFFLKDRADLRDFFSLLPLILAFIIPAITMRLFADEYRSNTYEITRTLPLPLSAVIMGKFMAALTLVIVMLLPTVSYPIFISRIGDLDWGPVLGGYIGAFLLAAAYTSIGLLASSLTKNQIVAYIIGIALLLFLSMIDRMLLFLPGTLTGVFQAIGADSHFQMIAKGVFDTRDLIYFLTLTIVGLFATLLVMDPPTFKGREQLSIGLQLAAQATFLFFLIVVNIASATLFTRIDLTQDQIHSLSPISRDTVASLQEPVTVRVFFSRNLPAPYNNVEQSLRDLLSAYALTNPMQFNYAFYAMSQPEASLNQDSDQELSENEKLARRYGIFPIQIQQVEEDELKLTNAYMGIAILYGDSAQTLPAVTSAEQLEYDLTTTIRALTERSTALLSRTEPLEIELYLSSAFNLLSSEFEQFPNALEELVGSLNREYYDKLRYSLHDPSIDDDVQDAARALELPSLRLTPADDSAAPETEAYATVVINTGNNLTRLNLLRPSENGYKLVEIDTLRQEIQVNLDAALSSQQTIGYLASNGTPRFRGGGANPDASMILPDLTHFYQAVTREYEISGFLAERGIADGIRTVLVAGPRTEFSDYDLFQLDQFLMRGGSLILLLDAYDIEVASNQSMYWQRETGIEKLIEHYGVRLTANYLLDEQSYVVNDVNPNGNAVQIPVYSAPRISQDQLNPEFSFLRQLDNITLLNVNTVELTDTLPDGVTAYPLVRSSQQAWVIEDDPNYENPAESQPPPASEQSQYTIAYLLEGSFESYFADKDLPALPSVDTDESSSTDSPLLDDTVISSYESFLPRSSGGKLIVMGSSMTLHQSLIDPEGRSPTALFVLNMLDFMNGREGIAEMRVKGSRFRVLNETTPFVRGLTRTFNMVGLPAIVILIGVVVWLLHRARRRRIQRMFTGGGR